MPKLVTICPLIKELFKGDDNTAAAVVEKHNMKTNKSPFQGTFNYQGNE